MFLKHFSFIESYVSKSFVSRNLRLEIFFLLRDFWSFWEIRISTTDVTSNHRLEINIFCSHVTSCKIPFGLFNFDNFSFLHFDIEGRYFSVVYVPPLQVARH